MRGRMFRRHSFRHARHFVLRRYVRRVNCDSLFHLNATEEMSVDGGDLIAPRVRRDIVPACPNGPVVDDVEKLAGRGCFGATVRRYPHETGSTTKTRRRKHVLIDTIAGVDVRSVMNAGRVCIGRFG